jgi:phenylacetate-CoA ligase
VLPGILYASVQAMKSYGLSPTELREVQEKKLRKMLRYCYDYVPFYHKCFREKGLAPEDFRKTEDLRLLQTLSRQLLSENSSGIVVPSKARGMPVRFTSGTTGRPVRLYSSPEFFDTMRGLDFRGNWIRGVRPWHKAAVVLTGSNAETTSSLEVGKRALVLGFNFLFGAVDLRVIAVRQLQFYTSNKS